MMNEEYKIWENVEEEAADGKEAFAEMRREIEEDNFINELQQMNEQAKIDHDQISGRKVFINSDDHNPPHIHWKIVDKKITLKISISSDKIIATIPKHLSKNWNDYPGEKKKYLNYMKSKVAKKGIKSKYRDYAQSTWDDLHEEEEDD